MKVETGQRLQGKTVFDLPTLQFAARLNLVNL
jgi:hypothetical protein